jgi:hypothetical protein
MQLKKTVLALLITLVITSCEREIGNLCYEMGRDPGLLPIQQIGEKLAKDTVDCWLKISDTSFFYKPTFYQIDDQKIFEELVECNCNIPEFNFRDYTLLMGYFYSFDGFCTVKTQRVSLFCFNFEQYILYTVYVETDRHDTIPSFVQYHAVIPKLPKGFKSTHTVSMMRK